MKLSRRDFLKTGLGGLAFFSAAATVPVWIAKSAQALAKSLPADRKLVIVQLGGGNDGLNTVIPIQDDLYLGDQLRPNLRITGGFEETTLDPLNALHPRLHRLARWYKEGQVAIVQNVGYPNPNLSHFVSTDYWERGTSPDTSLTTTQGWMSRFFDNQCAGIPADQIDALAMLAAGMSFVPATLDGSGIYRPPAVPEFEAYVLRTPGHPAGLHRVPYIEALNSTPALAGELDFLGRSSITAQTAVQDMGEAAQTPLIHPYPGGSLGTGLDMVSRVIRGGFPTPIFYVTQGGYDTHANQWGTDPATTGDHPMLLDVLDQALDAFLKDMQASGHLDKVLVLTFTEFGRRVAENASNGTDHGAGNNLFVLGGSVAGGIYGGQPDLANLFRGNLPHSIDFRSVYARVIQDWMAGDPEAVFGAVDYNNPLFNIPGGMAQIPIFGSAPVPGDVDGNGRVNVADLQHVVNASIGKGSPFATDVTGDGRTNAADIQSVAGMILSQ